MSVMQSNLPYKPDALEPHLSETSVVNREVAEAMLDETLNLKPA
jgi:hypothetical protein